MQIFLLKRFKVLWYKMPVITHLEELSQSRFSLGLRSRQFHCDTEVVDEAAVDVQYYRLGEACNKHVSNTMVPVPVGHCLCKRNAEQRVALQDLREAVEQCLYFGGAKNGRAGVFKGLFVVLSQQQGMYTVRHLKINPKSIWKLVFKTFKINLGRKLLPSP